MDESLTLGESGSLAMFAWLASCLGQVEKQFLGIWFAWSPCSVARSEGSCKSLPVASAGESSHVTSWFLSPGCSVGDLFPSASQALLLFLPPR